VYSLGPVLQRRVGHTLGFAMQF